MLTAIRQACLAALALATCAVASAASASYEVAARWPLGGDGGWDYLEMQSAAHLLYVSRATHVIVVDTARGAIVGDIGDTPGVHGIALAPELNRGFISAGKANQVKVFDLATRAVLASIDVGSNPDAILYEPKTRQVLSFNGASGSVSVIDAARELVVATVPLGGKPEFARAGRDASVFVNIEDRNQLVAFDAAKRAVLATWSLPGCEAPTGLALDIEHHRSFSVCSNAVMTILDTRSGRALASLPIGRGVDGAVFDPASQNAFSANGEGSITVVHEADPEHFTVVQTLASARGARTVALDAKTHILYLPSAEFGEPPPAAPPGAHPRPPILPGTFFLLSVKAAGPAPAR